MNHSAGVHGLEAISERGGAMGTMVEAMFGRGKMQEESMVYDMSDGSSEKHDGSLPLVGVNTFRIRTLHVRQGVFVAHRI